MSMKAGITEKLAKALMGAGLAFSLGMGAQSALAEEQPVPAPTPDPLPPALDDNSARAKKALDEDAVNDQKLREEIQQQASQHFQAGKELFSVFKYEEALRELELAVQLDRNNAEARNLLIRTKDILGVRRDRIRSAVAQLYNDHKVEITQRLMDLDNRIDWGRRFIREAQENKELSLGDRIRRLENAVGAFERAQELIKWMPVEVNIEEQKNEVARLIGESRKGIKTLQANMRDVEHADAVAIAESHRARKRVEDERRLNKMVDQAKALQETAQYEEAIGFAEKILEIDPANVEAATIISVSRDRNFNARNKYIETEYKEQFKLNREQAERRNVPHKDYLVYPDNWHEISQRTTQEGARKAEDPWKQEVRRKMSRRVTFEFVDTELKDAIAFLNSLTKVTIILDPKVVAKGADKTPITLRVADMELDVALRWVLKLADLEYDLRSQAVFVTDHSSLASNVDLAIYDVRDLTTTITDFPGPRIDMGTGQGQVVNPFANAQPAASLQAADLQTLIKERLMAAEFADPATSIEENGGKLVVMQRPEVHDRIRQLLQSFRDTQSVQVLTQVRFIDVTDGFLETIGIHFTGLDAAPGDRGVPNAVVDPLRQPSRSGLFQAGGGPGITPPLPSDIQPSVAFQFQDFVSTPPYVRNSPAISIIRPRLDPNFPTRGNTTVSLANAPAGIRRQWWDKALGSPVLTQGLTQNLLRLNPLASVLGSSISSNPNQGALFQFRFLQSVQASAVLQAVRKDQTADQLLAPKLMQFNNQRSHILVAQQRSYIRDYDISGSVYDPTLGTFLTGVVLEVKPTVSNDKRYITLDLRPGTATELTPPQIIFLTNSGDVNNGGGTINLPVELPNLELRSINTTVTVPDNGTMLFSGLINDRKIDAKSGVPFFSDLPIIGRFFSNNNKERVRRNLLVLVNSRVVLFDEEEKKL
jgi:type II secretory pathway component GspD/PulD (secretin)/Flp pilus assembly protein TadD